MNEEYLNRLWNWSISQDPTLEGKHTYDSWKQKISSNSEYQRAFYDWIQSRDETFSKRRPYDQWTGMVSGKKKEPTDSVGEPEKPITTSATADQKKETQRSAGSNFLTQLNKAANTTPVERIDKRESIFEGYSPGKAKYEKYTVGYVSEKGKSKYKDVVEDTPGKKRMISDEGTTYEYAQDKFGNWYRTDGTKYDVKKGEKAVTDIQAQMSMIPKDDLDPDYSETKWEKVDDVSELKRLDEKFDAQSRSTEEYDKYSRNRADMLKINSSFMDQSDNDVAEKLNNSSFSEDFIFEPAGLSVNAIRVTTRDGLNSQTFYTSDTYASTNAMYATKLQQFLTANQPSKERSEALKAFESDVEGPSEYDKRLSEAERLMLENGIDISNLPQDSESTRVSKVDIDVPMTAMEDIQRTEKAKKDYKTQYNYLYSLIDGDDLSDKERADRLRASIGTIRESAMDEFNKDASIYLSDIDKSVKYNSEFANRLSERANEIKEDIANNGYITDEQKKELQDISKSMTFVQDNIESLSYQLSTVTDLEYDLEEVGGIIQLQKEKEGSFAGNFLNEYLKGATIFLRGAGMPKDQVEALVEYLGDPVTTREYASSEDRTMLEKGLSGLASSLGVATTSLLAGPLSKYASYLGFYELGYYEMMDEINENPNMKDIPDSEKQFMSAVYGMTAGMLERFGLMKMISKNPAGKKIPKLIMSRVFKSLPKNATEDVIELAIKNDIKKLLAQKAINIIGTGIVEYSTEAAQEADKIAIQEIYDAYKGEDFFKNGDAAQITGRVNESGVLGIIGSGVLSTTTQSATFINESWRKRGVSNELAQMIKNVSSDAAFRSTQVNYLKSKVVSGEITAQQAKDAMVAYDEMASRMKKIPEDVKDVVSAYDLITEKQRLEKEMEGMDKALVANKAARVAEINSELESLTKTEEDAVQEQTTGEVPVQPEAKVGEEVEEGAPTPESEVTTEKGKAEEVTPEKYVEELSETKESNPEMYWSVDDVDIESAKKGTVIEVEGGRGLVGEDGDIKGVFKVPGSERSGVADEILQKAVKAGGTKLDNFDIYLTKIYERNGFRVAARTPFNEEYAPDGWNKEKHGTPDVVAMVYDPNNELDIEEKTFEDYDEMIAYRDSFVDSSKSFESVVARGSEAAGTGKTAKVDLKKNQVTQDNVVEIRDQFDETQEREYNAVESVRRVLKAIPKVKVFVHKTTDEYNSGIANATGLSKESIDAETRKSKGEYIPSANEIHINLEAGANALTVFHEAFHAVVKAKGFNNADMKGFVSAVKRSGNLSPELNKQLDEFSSQYESGEVNEEFLSELVGNLASSAETMNRTQLQKLVDAINKLFGKIGLTPFSGRADRKQVIDFLNGVSQSLSQGREIADVKVPSTVKAANENGITQQNDLETIGEMIESPLEEVSRKKRFGSDRVKIEVVYSEQNAIERLKKEGKLSEEADISVIENKRVATTSPDDMLVGLIIVNGKEVATGNGGVFFVTKFGDVWASSNRIIADQIAKRINDSLKQNGDAGYLLLVKGSDAKLISSPQGAISSLAVVETLLDDNLISLSDFRNAINQTLKDNPKTKATLKVSGKQSAADLKSAINNLFNDVSKSSFDNRGTLVKSLIANIGKTKSAKQNSKAIQEFFGGDINKSLSWSKAGVSSKEASTKESIIDLIAGVSREELTKGLNGGDVYAAIEVTEEVYVDEDSHQSYPYHIKTKSGKSPKLILLKNREHGSEVMTDVDGKNSKDLDKSFDGKVLGRASNGYGEGIVNTSNRTKQPSRKKQLGDPKKEAIDDAKAKYELSKKRGNTEEQAIESAIADLQKNDWYENASDTERDSAVRDLEKQLGIKQKSAPSAAEILGKPKRETKTYGVNALRREFITAHNKAYREGAKSEKDARKALAEFLKERIGKIKGIVKGDKLTTVINRALKMNLSNPEMADRFADYVIKLSKDAEYGEKLSKSNKLRSKIRKKLKQKDIQDNNKSLAKKFLSLDPKYSESIDEYLENAEKVLSSLEKTGIRRGALSVKQQANVDQVLEFIGKSIEYQNKVKMDMIELSFPELFDSGAITRDMSPAEAMYIVENIDLEKTDKKISEKKLQEMRDRLSKSIDAMSAYLSDMIKSKQDPMTGEDIVLTTEEIQNLKSLLKIDQNSLTLEEMFTFTDLLQNAAINQEISSVATFVEKINGRIEANKMYKENGRLDSKGSVVSSVVNPASGVTLITSQILGGINRAKEFLLKSGFNAIRDGKAQAIKIAREAVDQYDSMFAKKKANGEGFDSKFNRIERRMYSFLIRSVNGSKLQDAKEFTRRLKLIREQVQLFESEFADENMRRKAAKLREVADKLGIFEDGVTRDDIIARVDKVNADAVSFWIEKFAQYYPEMAEVSMSVYNRELSADINYIPDAYKRVITVLSTDVDKMAENASRNGAFGKYDTESTSLTVANRPNALPSEKFGEVRKTTMYIDMDFDSVVSNAFSEAMTDIKTAKPIRRFQGFINSASFQKMVANERNRKMMVDAMERYIRNTKGITASSKEQNILGRSIDKIVSTISTLGGSVLLGGADQIIKQSVSMVANTVMNSVYVGINDGNFSASIGGLYLSAGKNAGFKFSMMPPIALVASKKYNQWLIDGMVDIAAFRGIESMGTIDQAKFKSQADSVLEKGLDNIKALPEAYVKLFLVNGDKMVAKSAFLMYYKKHLVKSGKSPIIDFSKPMDQKAKSYAMAQVSKQQGESDADMSSVLYSKDTNKSFRNAVKLLMPLSSFILNKKASITSDLSILLRKNADKQDRLSAVQSMSSSIAEVAIYSAVSIMLREMIISQIATAITGYDEEELDPDVNKAVKKENKLRDVNDMEPMSDEEETAFRRIKLAEKKARQNEGMFITNLFKDLSPLPPFLEYYQLTAIDEGRKLMQEYTKSDEIEKAIKDQEKIDGKKMTDIKRKEFIANYIEKETTRLMIFDNDNNFGSFGFLGDQMSEDFELVKAERTGEIKTYSGTTKYLTKEQKEIARNLNYLLATSKVAPKDVRKVVMKSFRQLKKMALTANQLENYNAMKEMSGDKYTPQKLVEMIKKGEKLSDKKKETYNQIIKEYDKKDIPEDIFEMIMNGKEASDIRVEIYRRTGVTAKR